MKFPICGKSKNSCSKPPTSSDMDQVFKAIEILAAFRLSEHCGNSLYKSKQFRFILIFSVKITITWGYLVCPICIQKPYHVADHKSYHIQLHPIIYPCIWLILYPPLWDTKSLDPYPQAATIALRSSAKVGNQTCGSSVGRAVSSFFWHIIIYPAKSVRVWPNLSTLQKTSFPAG